MTGEGTPVPAEPQGGLRQQALRGVVWTTLEKWSVRLSTLVGFIILGNLLTPEQFGIVALAMAFISFSTTLADGGFAAYLLQAKRLTDASTNMAFFISTTTALVLSAVLAALAGPIGRALDVPELRAVLPALAAALFLAGLSTVPAALLQRELRFKELAVRQVVATVLSIVVAVVLAFAGAGVWALVAQTLVRGVVSSVVLWAMSDYRPRWTFDREELATMTSFGAQSLGVQILVATRAQGEVFILGALAGPVALGYWAVAGRLVNVVIDVFSSVVGVVAKPVFARLQDAPERLSRALGSTRALAALVLVPALVLLSLVSDEVVPAVFGEQWAPATGVASLLALSALLAAFSHFDRSALMSTGHPGAELAVTATTVAVQLGLVVLLHEDLELVALAVVVTMGLAIPVRLLIVRRLCGVPLRAFSGAATVLLAGGLAAAAVVGAQRVWDLEGAAYVAAAFGVGAVVYAAAVLLVARPVAAETAGIARGVLARRTKAGHP